MCVLRRNSARAEPNRSVDRTSRSIKHGLAMMLRRELGAEIDEGLGRTDEDVSIHDAGISVDNADRSEVAAGCHGRREMRLAGEATKTVETFLSGR